MVEQLIAVVEHLMLVQHLMLDKLQEDNFAKKKKTMLWFHLHFRDGIVVDGVEWVFQQKFLLMSNTTVDRGLGFGKNMIESPKQSSPQSESPKTDLQR